MVGIRIMVTIATDAWYEADRVASFLSVAERFLVVDDRRADIMMSVAGRAE
jgi:hypothetical protein